MASSGNFSTNKYSTSSHGTIGLNLSWSILSQSIANNTSTIRWTLKSNGTMSSGYYVQAGPVTVVIGGKTVLNTKSRFNMRGSGGYSETGTITIAHNEDGSKSVSMSVKAAIYSASVNCTGSKTYALDKINRYALISSATDFDDEGNPTVVYTNPAGDMVSDIFVRLKWLNADGVTQEATDWSSELDGSGGSYTFDLANYRTALRAACPNSNSLAVTVDLKSTLTVSGVSTEYHSEKAITMSIVNANPTAGAVTYSDQNASVVAITGGAQIVQKNSTLRISTAASTALKGASIVSYSLNFNGVTTDITNDRYLDIVQPDYAGTIVATVTTTDSRGNTSTATASVVITPWQKPSANITLERVNGFETNTTLTVSGTISTVSGSSMYITERHRIVNGIWSAAATVVNNDPTTLALDNTKEWEVEVTIRDGNNDYTLGSNTYLLTVGKGIPIMFIDSGLGSVSINGFPDEEDQLFVGGKVKLKPNDTDAGVVLPHVYSENEQIIGYWTDGRPIYEKTIELSADISIPANAWKNTALTVAEDIIIIDGKVMYYSSQYDMYSVWNFMAIQTNTSNKKAIDLYNARDAACNVNRVIIRYIKPIQT